MAKAQDYPFSKQSTRFGVIIFQFGFMCYWSLRRWELPPRSNPNESKKSRGVSNAQHVVCHHVFYISQTILESQDENVRPC